MSAMSFRGQSAANRYSPGGTRLMSGVGSRAELMEGYRICAKCGVDDFTQHPYRPPKPDRAR
jgi:hypothetical protein